VLFVEFLSILLGKSAHFDIANGEPILFNQVDNFSWVHVAIRFYHSKSFTFLRLKLCSGEVISVVNYFQLAGVNVQNRSNENIFKLYVWILSFLQEHFSYFKIKHLDCPIFGVVCKVVGTNERCSRVIPFDHKYVSIIVVRHWLFEKEKFKKVKFYNYKLKIISIPEFLYTFQPENNVSSYFVCVLFLNSWKMQI